METINDIVREMRKRFEPYAKSDSNDARYVAYLGYAEFADRIEAAVVRENRISQDSRQVQSVTICNRLGNAAKMRSELYKLASWIRQLTSSATARERGIACSEVRNIAVRIENIADNGGIK